MTKMTKIEMPAGLELCERGNVLLTEYAGPGVNAWLRTGEQNWLHIRYIPGNSPALTVRQMPLTEAQLWDYICDTCDGWTVRALNLDVIGVDRATAHGFINAGAK